MIARLARAGVSKRRQGDHGCLKGETVTAMLSFELQVYKAGKWEFDSYFDDRETALFEAERLHDSERYNGIRLVEEQFVDGSELSECSVIFSRIRKPDPGDDPRLQASREVFRVAVRTATKPERDEKATARKARGKNKSSKKGKARTATKSRASSGSKKSTSLNKLTIMAVLIAIIGVGAMLGLRFMAGSL